MALFRILKFSLLIGFGAISLMIVDFEFILNQYSLFGYTEFWGTIVLVSVALYFFTKRNFVKNPDLSQYQLFYPALAISLLGGLFYGIFSWLFIIFFSQDYSRTIYEKALVQIPQTFKNDTEGTAFGIAFTYAPEFQLIFKFIGTSLFGLFYSLFLVNHFLWIQDLLKKYKNT